MFRFRPILFWMAVTFSLNLLWEVAQISFYTLWTAGNAQDIAWAILHCSVGDVLIASGVFLVVARIRHRLDWPIADLRVAGPLALLFGLAYTAWSEWRNVYVLGSWAYASGMPTIAGIGLLPLLQWIAVPVISWVIFRGKFR